MLGAIENRTYPTIVGILMLLISCCTSQIKVAIYMYRSPLKYYIVSAYHELNVILIILIR